MRPARSLSLLSGALLAQLCIGQETVIFDPVEASVADVSVLATSLRVEDPGLAPGTGFTQVYQVPGSASAHFRSNGGLYAVFDQSVYLSWNGINFPEIPPSTTFYIGTPGFLLNPEQVNHGDSSDVGNDVTIPVSRRDGRSSGAPGKRPGYGYVPAAGSSSPVPGQRSDEPPKVKRSEDITLPRFHTDVGYRSRRLMEIRLRREAAWSQSAPCSTP